VVGGFTGGALATYVGVRFIAGVPTLQSDTGLVTSTIIVTSTLCVASGVWISQEVRWTGTLSSVINSITVSILTTSSLTTGAHTSVRYSIT